MIRSIINPVITSVIKSIIDPGGLVSALSRYLINLEAASLNYYLIDTPIVLTTDYEVETSFSTGQGNVAILSDTLSSDAFILITGTGQVRVRLPSSREIITTTTYLDNDLHHIKIIKTGVNFTLIVDGITINTVGGLTGSATFDAIGVFSSSNYYHGILADVIFNDITGGVTTKFALDQSTGTTENSIGGGNSLTYVNIPEANRFECVQESRFVWLGTDNYWTFGDVIADGTATAFTVIAGSTGQGITRGDANIRFNWASNTLDGDCRFVAGTAVYNVSVGQSPDLATYYDTAGNERLYFQTRVDNAAGSLTEIEVNPVVPVVDPRPLYTIVHVGDSITNYMLDGANIADYEALCETLNDSRVDVVNEGVGGDTIQDMAARLPAILATYSSTPHVLFVIMAGTNQELPEDLAAYSVVLEGMVADIQAAGHECAVANKTQSYPEYSSSGETAVNTLHNNVVCENDTPDWFNFTDSRPTLDMYRLTEGHHAPPTWFIDSVHPNALGSLNMYTYFAEEITPRLSTLV